MFVFPLVFNNDHLYIPCNKSCHKNQLRCLDYFYKQEVIIVRWQSCIATLFAVSSGAEGSDYLLKLYRAGLISLK